MANEIQDVSGIKKYFRRKLSLGILTLSDLDTLADEHFGKVDESVIVSTTAHGSGVSSQVSIPANIMLRAIEEIIAEGVDGRNMMVYPDYRNVVSRT